MHYRRIFKIKKYLFQGCNNYINFLVKKLKGLILITNLNLCWENKIVVLSLVDLENHCSLFNHYLESKRFKKVDILLPKKISFAY